MSPRYLVCLLSLALTGLAAAQPTPRLDRLDLMTQGYPHAFFFRASENLTQRGYDRWAADFSRLGGIEGKCLEEEVAGRSSNIPLFTRFKAEHPSQMVLLHYNGNARDPRDRSDQFSAGHWQYYEGCAILDALPATTGVTTLRVGDPGRFRVDIGRYGRDNEDLVLCALDRQGRPDWSRAEQAHLVSIDRAAGTITVERAQFGTRPLALAAGEGWAAAHVAEGPWGKNGRMLWAYNHSTACPRDAQGRTCDDVLLDELATRLLPGGELAAYDGLEFDVLRFHAGGGPRRIDTDGDGVGDRGILKGINQFGLGSTQFLARLRERLGEDRLILADGMSAANQRGFGILNGIESEGWPLHADPEMDDWSGGWNRHLFWNANARQPAFSYINMKYLENLETVPPVGRQRLILAVAQCLDASITWSGAVSPPPAQNELVAIWDELVQGEANKPYWLGQPRGPAVRMGLAAPDLLGGTGVRMAPGFLKRWEGDGLALTREGQTLTIQPTTATAALQIRLRNLPAEGPDLLVRLRVRGEPMQGYPATIARRMEMTTDASPIPLCTWLNDEWFEATFYLRDVQTNRLTLTFNVEGGEPVQIANVTVHAAPDTVYRVFEHGVVLGNPAHHPYVFDTATLMPGLKLRRLQGTAAQSPAVNNGQPVDAPITLDERDGLFLVIENQ